MPESPTSAGSIVLPKERGGWSLALEPVALGLLAAPSPAGAALAGAAVAGFLTRRPLKIALTSAPSDPRRRAALGWSAALASAVLALALLASSLAGPRALSPVLAAVPFASAFLWFDLRQAARGAEAELAGSIAFALLPAAFATAAGWSPSAAAGLAAIALARSVPTVLTVRSRLRMRKGEAVPVALVTAAGIIATAGLAALAASRIVPWPGPVLAALMLARTVFLLNPGSPAFSARTLGLAETGIGVVYVATMALAYRLR
jgi:hypothetical protein